MTDLEKLTKLLESFGFKEIPRLSSMTTYTLDDYEYCIEHGVWE